MGLNFSGLRSWPSAQDGLEHLSCVSKVGRVEQGMAANKAKTEIELATAAMNEHGFLLQQAVRQFLITPNTPDKRFLHKWTFEAVEYPVTAPDGSQTRIDILVGHQERKWIRLCIECKRVYAKDRFWLFWGEDKTFQTHGMENLFLETHTDLGGNIQDFVTRIPTYNYYLEVKRNEVKASNLESIEQAFTQCIRGQSGLAKTVSTASNPNLFRSIPVVVTTANLFVANFDEANINKQTGRIEESQVAVEEKPFLAVTYRASDSLKLRGASEAGRMSLTQHLRRFMVRTIFVVNSNHLLEFFTMG